MITQSPEDKVKDQFIPECLSNADMNDRRYHCALELELELMIPDNKQ